MTRPGPTPLDTAQRSLRHWSEAGREEMRAFYALATETTGSWREPGTGPPTCMGTPSTAG